MKFLILGLGISGKAAAAFLLKQGNCVIAFDQQAEGLRSREDVKALISQGLVLEAQGSLEGVEQIILSPGIPLTHPVVIDAKDKNIEVIGEVEFAFRHIRNRCIGVTGSNGKTTTTLMIAHVLGAKALGNVGVGLSTYLLNPDEKEVLVVELSSFQLETLTARCLDFALITNITPNHLDRYPSMEEYMAAKWRIRDCVKETGMFFVSFEEFLPNEKEQNVQAAFAICKQFGITEEKFYNSLKTFKKPPHRMEWVANIAGVEYYNDSKSSNIDSVMYAVKNLSGPLILIVGGMDKGSSYAPWIQCFLGKVTHIVAYGMAREKIASEMAGACPLTMVGPFAEAVSCAIGIAREKDTVLLSPGCSSYDQFLNFERRGDAFKKLIAEEEWIEKKQS